MTGAASALPTQCCRKCRFWDVYTDGLNAADLGDCRRRPPLIDKTIMERTLITPTYGLDSGRDSGFSEMIESALHRASAFPVTGEESWCGDFESRSPAVPL